MTGKYQAYAKYQESCEEWLGKVPDHWDVIQIKHLSVVKRGASPRPIDDPKYFDEDGEYVWTRIADVTASDVYLIKAPQRLSDLGSSLSVKLEPESLFLSIAGSVGKPCITGMKACIHDGFVYFPDLKIPSKFLFYVFAGEQAYKGLGKFGTQLNLNTDTVGGIKIGCAETEELEGIVNFLDHETAKIDTLIEKQQQLIKLLKEKRQAVISHAITKGLNPNAPMCDSGVEWLGDVPEHWEVRAVSKLSQKITNGYVGPTRDILVPVGVPYVQATHIKKGKVNFDDAYFVRQPWSDAHAKSILVKGDVLIVQTGAGTGDIGLVTENETGFNCHALIIVQPIKSVISGDFLSMAFQSQYGYSVLYSIRTGGMHPHLNCGEVQFVKIPVPPRKEQEKIIEHIRQQLYRFDTLVEKQLLAIELMQERRTALISAAVTGKIDVRHFTSNNGQASTSSSQGAINGR